MQNEEDFSTTHLVSNLHPELKSPFCNEMAASEQEADSRHAQPLKLNSKNSLLIGDNRSHRYVLHTSFSCKSQYSLKLFLSFSCDLHYLVLKTKVCNSHLSSVRTSNKIQDAEKLTLH